jgi:carbamoyltransferase
LELEKSEFPAITHVDLSARVQTVHKDIHGKFWELLQAYKRVSGHSILVNTSFNVRGEPIVCTPDEAIRCFVQTDMDVLVMGSRLLEKAEVDSQKLSQLKARFTSESAQRESD